MLWLVFGLVVVALIISSAISTSTKEQEKSAFERQQIASNASRSTLVQAGQSSYRWSVVPHDFGTFESSFILSAEAGPSFVMRVRTSFTGTELFVNDSLVSKSAMWTMTDRFYMQIAVGEVSMQCCVIHRIRLTAKNSITVYINDQFVGEFLLST